MLERAIEKAKESNVKVDFINADARYLEFNKEFDLALIICEGGFPLMETDEMNFKILQNAAKSLKIRQIDFNNIKWPLPIISFCQRSY